MPCVIQVELPRPPEEHRALLAAEQQERATKGFQEALRREASDTEPDSDAAPPGAGPRGAGDAMTVGSHERLRLLCDGGGLCSLGLWPPWRRPAPSHPRLLSAGRFVDDYLDKMEVQHGLAPEDLFDRMARGSIEDLPFQGAPWDYAQQEFQRVIDGGTGSTVPQSADQPQRLRVRLLQSILALADDPDTRGMEHFCRGVRIGVGVRMPRTPAVYPRKRRWRLRDNDTGGLDDDLEGADAWRLNYKSATVHRDEVHRQLLDHHRRGLCLRFTPEEALQLEGLSVNSLGGVEKTHEDGRPPSVRVVMDATHGVKVNREVRQLDRDRMPTSLDVKRLQREQSLSGAAVGLAVDAQEAHRLVAVHPKDWPLQGCRSDVSGEIFTYRVGCFGVTTAAYWWSRLGGGLLRALHHLLLPRDEVWVLLMADDFKIESTAKRPARAVVKALLLLLLLGLPVAWPKMQGGTRVLWIGYEILLRELAVGISARRAAWCVSFLSKLSRDGRVDIRYFRSGLGRLSFVVSALEWERPFLSPLYTYLSLVRGAGHRALPLYVRLTARYLAERISLRRFYPSALRRPLCIDAFRIDAHAEGMEIGIGGWLPRRDHQGILCTERSPWFAFRLNPDLAPWAYARGEPFRSIAALEAVGVLAALLAFREHFAEGSDAVYTVRGLTDNKGNRATISRLQSTRFPLCAVLMEIAAQSEQMNVRLALDWVPRDWNAQADQLSNGDYRGFSDSQRVHINWSQVDWKVLHWAMDLGDRRRQETEVETGIAEHQGRRKPTAANSFRAKEPW